MGPEEQFDALVERFVGAPDVSVPGESSGRGFGSSALKVNGSIFAMLSSRRLVLKLPRDRVDALIATGAGQPFDAGKGRPMKEWVVVAVADVEKWVALATEALAFVGSQRR